MYKFCPTSWKIGFSEKKTPNYGKKPYGFYKNLKENKKSVPSQFMSSGKAPTAQFKSESQYPGMASS